MDEPMIPVAVRLGIVFLIGACAGSLVNWAIYTLAWRPRAISPWSRALEQAPPRRRRDLLPLLGWWGLRREAKLHGRGFWIRPMLIEFGLGVALAALYWWEVDQQGLIRGQLNRALELPWWVPLAQFFAHSLLACWMLAATFIDIDEKIIPDEVTVTGTILGLVLATIVPFSLLPHVAERSAAPDVGIALRMAGHGQAMGANGDRLWLEPVTAIAPRAWPPSWADPLDWRALLVGVACYWLWCFALAPRIWRGRHGVLRALALIGRRLTRELFRPPLGTLLIGGTVAIVLVWGIGGLGWNGGERAWCGLLTALVGLVGSGAIVWGVRIIGSAALRREAMGFGDVTLMMMIGTFLGWQACLVTFFLAPFAGLLVGVCQFMLRRDDVIPYGPFLCLGAIGVIVFWAPIWMWGKDLFGLGLLVPMVLVVCLGLLGVFLTIWQTIKMAIFRREV